MKSREFFAAFGAGDDEREVAAEEGRDNENFDSCSGSYDGLESRKELLDMAGRVCIVTD